jgi:predicted RNA methylase
MIRIEEHVLSCLSAGMTDGKVFRLPSQLDRADYVAVNKVLDAAGGKWNRKAKGHVFDEPAAEVIDNLILTGSYSRTKQDFGQFDTPAWLAAQVVEAAGITRGMSVLEPNVGLGNLVIEAERVGACVTGFEVDAKRLHHAKERCEFAGGINLCDFLLAKPTPFFERVVMNPPFARRADINHVYHATSFLKAGGRLVAIMSAGTEFRVDGKTSAFRGFVAGFNGTITRLPEDSFKTAGTSVNTVLVTLTVKV